jgi:hypothetical protein
VRRNARRSTAGEDIAGTIRGKALLLKENYTADDRQ